MSTPSSQRLKGGARHDITVNGPALAAHALRAGLVDEIQMFICPAVVGAGKRFFPDRVRLKLELVEEHRFRNGMVTQTKRARSGRRLWREKAVV